MFFLLKTLVNGASEIGQSRKVHIDLLGDGETSAASNGVAGKEQTLGHLRIALFDEVKRMYSGRWTENVKRGLEAH